MLVGSLCLGRAANGRPYGVGARREALPRAGGHWPPLLREVWPGACVIADSGSYDRVMRWSHSDDSYYDSTSGLCLWYNTDVSPNLWQYWYEPISGDYGDYGWMEYENGTWYIEVANGKWEPVPTRYDTAALWHIEPDESGRPSEDLPIVPAPT